MTWLSDTYLWSLANLFAAVLGIAGVGVLLARRLPVGDGRALTGRSAILSGLVLVSAAAATLWINPSLSATTQARAERERVLLAENNRAAKSAELDKEWKDVRDQIRTVNKDFHETTSKLESEALDGRVDPRRKVQQLNELKGDKRVAYDSRLRAALKRKADALKPLREDEAQLKRDVKALGPAHTVPDRNPSRDYVPLILPLLSGLLVFGVARLCAGRDEPTPFLSPAPAAQASLPPVRPPQPPVTSVPLQAPGAAGQGPSASLPSS